jgi:hypothetical protein
MPGRDVVFVRNAFTPGQLGTHRPSYVNALLIQRAGVLVPAGCNECQRRGLTPFPECRRIVGHFGSACGNCKWRDHAARCRVVEPDEGDSDGSGEDDGEGGGAGGAPDPPRLPAPGADGAAPAGSPANPIAV